MFDRFKGLARILSFILVINFLVFNFGIKPHEVKSLEISSFKSINYDIKVVENNITFDFENYLAQEDTIESIVLKKGNDDIPVERINNQKAWKTKTILIDNTTYQLNITAKIGGVSKKVISTFVYDDYNKNFKPIVGIYGQNVECDMKTWAANFDENLDVEVSILSTNGTVVIEPVVKKVKELKEKSLVFQNKKDKIPNGNSYIVRAKINKREYRRKFYSDIDKSKPYTKNLFVELTSGIINQNGNLDLIIKSDVDTKNGETFELYSDNKTYIGNKSSSKVFEFKDVNGSLNKEYNVKLNSKTQLNVREAMFSLSDLSKINKLNFKMGLNADNSIDINFTDMNDFFSHIDSKNKIHIYELNDNFEKGTKIGGKESGVNPKGRNDVVINSGYSLDKNKNYLVEATNGTHTISIPFIYVTMNGVTATNVGETSVTIGWDYPSGYNAVSGDKIEIYLRDKGKNGEFSSIAKEVLVHQNGSGSVDLMNTKSKVVNGIAPGTNYEAKVVLYNNRGSIVSYVNFETKPFSLTKFIDIEDTYYGSDAYKIAYPRSRTMTVAWDFTPNDIKFSDGDKVEIFVKPNGTPDFSGYPKDKPYRYPAFSETHTSSRNLNEIKRATITLPSWLYNFHVDLIYTIGGKEIITTKKQNEQGENAYNRKTVNVRVNKPSLQVTDITQKSAKVLWDYDKDFATDEATKKFIQYKPENGHVIKLHMKKINSTSDNTNTFNETNDLVFQFTQGGSETDKGNEEGKKITDISTIKEFVLNDLEPDQAYRIRLTHLLQYPKNDTKYPELTGLDNDYKSQVEYFNFKTGAFEIKNLKAEQDKKSPKINLTWDTVGVANLNDEDKVKIYLKEGNTSEYNQNPHKEVTIKELKNSVTPSVRESASSSTEITTSKNKTEIELPKYNTDYNVKVEYTVKDKKISEYVLVRADGEIKLNISEIAKQNNGSEAVVRNGGETWKATINWEYPDGYEAIKNNRTNDKIKLTVKEVTEVNNARKEKLPTNEEIEVSKDKVKNLTDLEKGKTYEVNLSFINDTKEVYSTKTSFKTVDGIQIVGLAANDVKSKTATLNWDYAGLKKAKGSDSMDSPNTGEFKDGDKIDIFIKYNKPKNQKEVKVNKDDLSDYTLIYTMKHPLKGKNISSEQPEVFSEETKEEIKHSKYKEENGDLNSFKSFNLTDLGVNKGYSVKVRYTQASKQATQEGSLYSSKAQGATTTEAEVSFTTKLDSFKSTVFVSNQTTATYGWEYPAGYDIQEGDKVDIYVKEVNETSGETAKNNGLTNEYGKPLLTLEHTNSLTDNETQQDGNSNVLKVNLKNTNRVDISGLTPEKKYKSAIVFTLAKDKSQIWSEIDITTKKFEIKSFDVDSYQEYDILVKWEVEPKEMVFSPGDTLKIFVKKASDKDYRKEAAYKLPFTYTDEETKQEVTKTLNNTFSDYVEAVTIGQEQNMKLVFNLGGREYTKELTFTNKIDDVKANVTQVDQTRAVVGIEAPSNYQFVYGDKLLIYAKDEFAGDKPLDSEDFLVFEGLEAEDLSIADNMKSIELSYLLPEAKYEVLVALELQDGTAEPAKLEFTTQGLPITDIKLESLKANNAVISWGYGDDKVDFFKDEDDYDFSDKLVIAHKEADGTPFKDDIAELKKLKHVEYVGPEIEGIKDAAIEVEDPSKDYDVAVCYDLGGVLYMKQYKASYLSGKVEEGNIEAKGATLNWKYPSSISIGDGDKTEISIRKKEETSYPDTPATSTTGTGTTSYKFENLEGGTDYVARIQLVKEGITIDPVEVEFKTKGGEGDVVIENVDYEIKGTEAKFEIPNAQEVQVDTSQSIGLKMGEEAYKGFTVKFDESGTGFVIEPTIPKKKYTNIEVELPLKDGKKYKMVIKEFVTQPENITQDWLSNAYWFAFERFPDEEGYNYWYEDRMLKKTLNGEYFLKNLMFAEDEFTNRNLSENDLIAALYQIVVNREFDQEGLNFWIGIYNENLKNAQGNKKLAQEVLVDRMVHEPEFGKLCDKAGIFWRQSDQDAAGVPSF